MCDEEIVMRYKTFIIYIYMSRKLNIIVEKSQVTELPTVTHSPVCAFSPKPNSRHLIVTMTASAKLARVLRATAAKVSEERRILEEYRGQLEMVGPAPGQPHHQHEAMVSGG